MCDKITIDNSINPGDRNQCFGGPCTGHYTQYRTTPCENVVGENLEYLDRHHVVCPEFYGMRSWQLRDNIGRSQSVPYGLVYCGGDHMTIAHVCRRVINPNMEMSVFGIQLPH